MAEKISSASENIPPEINNLPSKPYFRLARYILSRALILIITVAIGLYLTIMVVNLGGYVDKIYAGLINESIGAMIQGGWLRDTAEPERTQIINQTRYAMEEAQGLHQPYLLRTARWLARGMVFDLGSGSVAYNRTVVIYDQIRTIILKHLPYTLVLVGLTNLIIFMASLFVALFISRNHGSWLDRSSLFLVPLTSAPSWIFGIFLIYILASRLKILPYPQVINPMSDTFTSQAAPMVLRQMIMPVIAIFLSTFFIGVYTWRTFFLIYRHEDYVDLAVAKGLTAPQVERRYILRPSLPYVLTSFALMLIVAWQSAIALEVIFLWPGLGIVFFSALSTFNTPLILGIVVIFAYLLMITVFILDIVYALVDPRVAFVGQKPRARSKPVRLARSARRSGSVPPAPLSSTQPVHETAFATTADQHLADQHLADHSPTAYKRAGVHRRLQSRLKGVTRFMGDLRQYPMGMAGLVIIVILIIIAIGTVVFVPYNQVLLFWRGQGSEAFENYWIKNPRYALPEWVNWFRKDKLPVTQIIDSKDLGNGIITRQTSKGTTQISIPFQFNFNASETPQDLILFLKSSFKVKPPLASISIQSPDGRVFDLGTQSVRSRASYYLSQDKKLQRKLQTVNPTNVIFSDPVKGLTQTLPGDYKVNITAFTFEPESTLEAEAVLYGKVYGLAGTDNYRRDLSLAILWGFPVALTFGILGAILTNVLAMGLAALGVWFSGWTDGLIQRISEINMILPTLPIIVMVYLMFSKSIWVILGVLVILSIFGSAVKNYRAVFLQIKEAPYMESAQSYGASPWRIIRRYLIPPVLPVLIPQMVIMVPVYVFYEATLAFLGIYDPYLPTWGKVIHEALAANALANHPYWLFEPLVLIVITSLAFAFLGLALDRLFNPRLRVE